MSDLSPDFGTGLRAHLGLEQAALELGARPELAPEALVSEATTGEDPQPASDEATLEALIAFESELAERERSLAQREAGLATRASALLATAQALHDAVLRDAEPPNDDELARMRRRKSGAA